MLYFFKYKRLRNEKYAAAVVMNVGMLEVAK